MFYEYHQNNSGGKFKYDEKQGIGPYVIIEAEDAEEANYRAKRIGLYFNGCRKGIDCKCCGDRWDEVDKYSEPTEKPTVYGSRIGTGEWKSLCDGKYDTFVHYKDGTIKSLNHYRPKKNKIKRNKNA